MEKVFPPEQQIDLKAAYTGLGGREIRWQQVDIGKDPFIRLGKLFPGTAPGSGVAYLVCWVKSPREFNRNLYYAMDWFGKVWINDQLVLPQVGGPWRKFARQPVRLKAGWNRILVKTSCGTDGWMANFAVDDAGDLEYSPTPPEGGK